MCKVCRTSTIRSGLKHPTAGSCLHSKANLNLESKVFPCLLRIVGSDPANTRVSDRWAVAALAEGLSVSRPPCFPVPGCPQAAVAASLGKVQGHCLSTLPATLAEPATPCWSHSRFKHSFTHEWTSSGGGPGGRGEGFAQQQPPLL